MFYSLYLLVKKIVPFSLNGLPVVPKPLGKEVDQFFTPDDALISSFKLKINQALENANSITDLNFLYNAFLDVALPLYEKHTSVNNSNDSVTLDIIAKKGMRDRSD